VIRLFGTALAEVHDEWRSGGAPLISQDSMALLKCNGIGGTIAAIDSGEEAPRIDRSKTITREALPSAPTGAPLTTTSSPSMGAHISTIDSIGSRLRASRTARS
jgi:hypothetical protein